MNNNNNNMFPSSTSSSSSQGQAAGSGGGGGGGLMRYSSAPSSVLSTALDSFSSAFTTQPAAHEGPNSNYTSSSSPSSSSSLVRHTSLPTGFHNYDYLSAAPTDNGFSMARANNQGVSRLNTQMSFTHSPKESLSRISEETGNINVDDSDDNIGTTNDDHHRHHHHHHNVKKRSSHHANFSMGLWDDNNHPLTFSVSPTKTINSNHGPHHDNIESHFQFGVPHHAALELATMDKFLNIPQDSVPCKIRAKRGFATHPRSIAERERRTRISGKLKKLQDLVPNMDKQTSYADMLDLAVQHIKSLQHEVQKLNNEIDGCECGCKEK